MDQSALVRAGHILVTELDNAGLPPRAAVWAHDTETDTWRLWIVPHTSIKDKRDFYKRIVEIVAEKDDSLLGIDAGDTQMVAETHPAIEGIRQLVKMPGLGERHLSHNQFNGFYLPEAIVLRSGA